MNESVRKNKVARIALWVIFVTVIGFSVIAYPLLPRLAPTLWVRWGYEKTGDRVLYTGIQPPDRGLEDHTEVLWKRHVFVPGPQRLEVKYFTDGRIAWVHSEGRKKVHYNVLR